MWGNKTVNKEQTCNAGEVTLQKTELELVVNAQANKSTLTRTRGNFKLKGEKRRLPPKRGSQPRTQTFNVCSFQLACSVVYLKSFTTRERVEQQQYNNNINRERTGKKLLTVLHARLPVAYVSCVQTAMQA